MDLSRQVRIDISIDRVSIEGFGRHDEFALSLALQRNLSRLVTERGLPGGWSTDVTRADVRSAPLTWDGRGGDEGLAAALARQIYATFAS